MNRTLSVAGILLCATACGGEQCFFHPCPLPVALNLTITSAISEKPLSGVFVKVGGNDGGGCTQGTTVTCFVPGAGGTYEVDVGAPGFATIHRTFVVKGAEASGSGCGQCATAETQSGSFALVPAA